MHQGVMEQTAWASGERPHKRGTCANSRVCGIVGSSVRVSTASCLPFCESIQSSAGEVTGQQGAKAMRAGGGCISCISCMALHSLHARLHSTPHDQTSARCGRWAAEARQEAACLLTTVGAVKQANPGSVTACIESRQRATKQQKK
jgi:hypothetical protein